MNDTLFYYCTKTDADGKEYVISPLCKFFGIQYDYYTSDWEDYLKDRYGAENVKRLSFVRRGSLHDFPLFVDILKIELREKFMLNK